MRKLLLYITLFLFSINISYSQFGSDSESALPDSVKADRVEKIYRNLEYNTTAFDDLKEYWVLTDPTYVREVFNRFIVYDGLFFNDNKITLDYLKEKSQSVYASNVYIEFRKRYYDDEIEMLRFIVEETGVQDTSYEIFDPVYDHIYIQDVLGEKTYEDLKSRFYAHNDLTKEIFDSKKAYNFDIYLNLFNPELMVWSISTNNRNLYLASVFGKWGNNKIISPGWYYPAFFTGIKATYIDYLINNIPNSTYEMELGVGLPAQLPTESFNSEEIGRLFYNSGGQFYVKLQGNPLNLFIEGYENFDFKMEGAFGINENDADEYNFAYNRTFFSTRNYFEFTVYYKNIIDILNLGVFNAGLGYATSDILEYDFVYDPVTPTVTEIGELNGNGGFKHSVVGEMNLVNHAGLLSHEITLLLNYNFSESALYFGLNMEFILSNSFGIDIRYVTPFTSAESLPPYRYDNYIAISPIIRINY